MTSNLPLAGITVLDLTQIMAGPFCTMLLADMGANVIKVEKPGTGDDTRNMGPPFINGESAAFLGINRNKRGIVLNLKDQRGLDILRRMVKNSDVLVQNFRTGTLERMGLDYNSLKALNPKMVYCAISGFGATGPYKNLGGFDLVAQGMSGIMSVTGHPDSPPVKAGVPITDLNAGMLAAYGILTAYINRLRTGEGQMVDTSLLEAGIAYTFWESAEYFATGNIPAPKGSGHRLNAPYQAFYTSDGYINIGAANQANWERLCKSIGRQDLLDNPAYRTNSARMNNLEELVGILQDTFASNNVEHWIDILQNAGVPCGPIYNMDQVYNDPHVKARDMLVEVIHPKAGPVKNIGIPIKLSETPASIRMPAPTLGQHTHEILGEFGYNSAQIDKFKADKTVE